MRYDVEHPIYLPSGTEYFDVELGWDRRKRHLFSTYDSAFQYAEKRLAALLKHPTAGPHCNGKKHPELLSVEWQDFDPAKQLGLVRKGWICQEIGTVPMPCETFSVAVSSRTRQ